MTAKTSKQITDRQQACRFLLTALLRQGRAVAALLVAIARPHLGPGDEEPGFFAAIVGLARILQDALDRLVAADEKVYAVNARLSQLRDQRDETATLLRQQIVRLRRTVESQYLAPRLDQLGFESHTARQPTALLRQADRIVGRFRGDAVARLLGPPFFAAPWDPRHQAPELGPTAGRLRAVLRRIDERQRELDAALVGKARTMTEHDGLFLETARTFEAWCRLAGQGELADRVRPSLRRPGRTEQEPAGADGSSRSDPGPDPDELFDPGGGQAGPRVPLLHPLRAPFRGSRGRAPPAPPTPSSVRPPTTPEGLSWNPEGWQGQAEGTARHASER